MLFSELSRFSFLLRPIVIGLHCKTHACYLIAIHRQLKITDLDTGTIAAFADFVFITFDAIEFASLRLLNRRKTLEFNLYRGLRIR